MRAVKEWPLVAAFLFRFTNAIQRPLLVAWRPYQSWNTHSVRRRAPQVLRAGAPSASSRAFQLGVRGSDHCDLRHDRLNTGVAYCLGDRFKVLRLCDDLPSVAFVVQVFSARLKHNAHQLFFIRGFFRNGDDALLGKHEAHRASLTQVAAVLGEGMPDFTHRAVTIVRCGFHNDGHTTRSVTLKSNFFVGGSGQLASSALNGPLDIVSRHVLCLCRSNGRAQARVTVRITAGPGRNRNFLDETGKNLAALRVESTFFVLNAVPF